MSASDHRPAEASDHSFFSEQMIAGLVKHILTRNKEPILLNGCKVEELWAHQTSQVLAKWYATRIDVHKKPLFDAGYVTKLINELKFPSGQQSGGQSGDAVFPLGPVVVKVHANGKKHKEWELFNRLFNEVKNDKDPGMSLADAVVKHPVLCAPIAAFVVTEKNGKQFFITIMPNAGHKSSPFSVQMTKEFETKEAANQELKKFLSAMSPVKGTSASAWIDLKGIHQGEQWKTRGANGSNTDGALARARTCFKENGDISMRFKETTTKNGSDKLYELRLAKNPDDAKKVIREFEAAIEYLESRGLMDYSAFINFRVVQLGRHRWTVFAYYGIIDFTMHYSRNNLGGKRLDKRIRNVIVQDLCRIPTSSALADNYSEQFLSGMRDVFGSEDLVPASFDSDEDEFSPLHPNTQVPCLRVASLVSPNTKVASSVFSSTEASSDSKDSSDVPHKDSIAALPELNFLPF